MGAMRPSVLLCLCAQPVLSRVLSQPGLRVDRGAVLRLSGGAEPSDAVLQATFTLNKVSASALADAQAEIAALRKSVTGGEAIPMFGAKADELVCYSR